MEEEELESSSLDEADSSPADKCQCCCLPHYDGGELSGQWPAGAATE